MRASVFITAAVAATSASASVLSARQYEGCEESCNPMRGWALGCRTDSVKCQQDCSDELLDATFNCYQCIRRVNPGQVESVRTYVGIAYRTCGVPEPENLDAPLEEVSQAPAESASETAAESASETAAESSASESMSSDSASATAAPATTVPAGAGDASKSGSAAAPNTTNTAQSTGVPTGTPAASSTGTVAPTASPSATPTGAAGKVGISLGAIALAVAAYAL